MNNKFSGAVTIGYASIFLTFLSFSLIYSGLINAPNEEYLPILMSFGFVLAVAGILALIGNDKIEGILFLSLGTFWFSFMLRFLWYPNLEANKSYAVFDGWVCFILAVILFYVWLASFEGHIFRKLLLLGFWLTFLAAAIANWFSLSVFSTIFAYLSLVSSLLGGLYSAYTIVDFGRLKKAKTN